MIHEDEYMPHGEEVIVSVGSNKIRKEITERLEYEFGWAIHPSAILGDDVSIDKAL